MIKTLSVQTSAAVQVVNVTAELRSLVSDVADGLALFYIPHTTAGLVINEDDEELRQDFAKIAQNWLGGLRPFAHVKNDNPNTEAHAISAFGGSRVTVAIEGGALDLGRYQNILLLEMDGPKRREIRCKIVLG